MVKDILLAIGDTFKTIFQFFILLTVFLVPAIILILAVGLWTQSIVAEWLTLVGIIIFYIIAAIHYDERQLKKKLRR